MASRLAVLGRLGRATLKRANQTQLRGGVPACLPYRRISAPIIAPVAARRAAFHISSPTLGVIPFKLADIGEGIAEVEVLQWFVKEGDQVKQFDKVCEVQSDKANVEITSRFDGVVTKVHYDTGDIAKVGEPLIDIEVQGESAEGISAPQEQERTDIEDSKSSATAAGGGTSSSSPISGGGNLIPFKLADIGEGIAEVEVLQWFVKEGDAIKQFDKVCEVQSDKANVEITSRYDGIVRQLSYKTGEMAQVGSTLMEIEVEGQSGRAAEAHSAAKGNAAESPTVSSSRRESAAASSTTSSGSSVLTSGRVLTTPAVRRLAKENNVDLATVRGTGPKGRVLKGDVLKFIKQRQEGPVQVAGLPSEERAPAAAADTPSSVVRPVPTPPAATRSLPRPLPSDQEIPIRGMQRAMVKSMTASLAIPHFHYADEVRMDKLIAARTELKPVVEQYGLKLSFLPFMLKAASLALLEYPVLNARVEQDGQSIRYLRSHNLSIAMDTPRGLVVPVLRDVQDRSVLDIAADLQRLQQLGRDGKLASEDLTGGTFSLSNVGNIGGTYLGPVIAPPQVAIVAVGKMDKLPRFNDKGEVEAWSIMRASFAGDHRVIDGATMARFSNAFKAYLENPAEMLIHLK